MQLPGGGRRVLEGRSVFKPREIGLGVLARKAQKDGPG